MLLGHGGGGGGEGYFCRSGGLVGGGSVFFRVQYLLLCLRLFQVSGRDGNFFLGCSMHKIFWF